MNHPTSIALAAALLTASCHASANGLHYGATSSRLSLEPIEDPLFYPTWHPVAREACRLRNRDGDCPLVLRSNGNAHLPTIPPVLTSEQPTDLLVTFTHHQTIITPLSGDEFQPDFLLQHYYYIDSPVADWASPLSHTGLGFNVDSIDGPLSFLTLVWRAVVLDGCASPPGAIPIEFSHPISRQSINSGYYEDVALFEATDDTTLTGPGFWNYQFAVEATAPEGSTALIDVRGTVSVTCTAGIP